jgi:hypothetical protein
MWELLMIFFEAGVSVHFDEYLNMIYRDFQRSTAINQEAYSKSSTTKVMNSSKHVFTCQVVCGNGFCSGFEGLYDVNLEQESCIGSAD